MANVAFFYILHIRGGKTCVSTYLCDVKTTVCSPVNHVIGVEMVVTVLPCVATSMLIYALAILQTSYVAKNYFINI